MYMGTTVPRIKYLESIYKGISVWIYYNDHGYPHVEIYKGKPEKYEAHMKLNLLDFSIIESTGFSERSIRIIQEKLRPYKANLLLDWYEITQR